MFASSALTSVTGWILRFRPCTVYRTRPGRLAVEKERANIKTTDKSCKGEYSSLLHREWLFPLCMKKVIDKCNFRSSPFLVARSGHRVGLCTSLSLFVLSVWRGRIPLQRIETMPTLRPSKAETHPCKSLLSLVTMHYCCDEASANYWHVSQTGKKNGDWWSAKGTENMSQNIKKEGSAYYHRKMLMKLEWIQSSQTKTSVDTGQSHYRARTHGATSSK